MMKNKLFLSLFALLLLVSCKAPVETPLVSRYYISDFGDDYVLFGCPVIELQFKDDSLVAGYYRGDTDEFNYDREECWPGFFVLPMEGLVQQEDTIRFVLNSNPIPYFFSAPVTFDIYSTRAAIDSGYHEWLQKSDFFKDSLAYKALLTPDSILLYKQPYWIDRTFNLISLDSLLRLRHRLNEEIEMNNRATN